MYKYKNKTITKGFIMSLLNILKHIRLYAKEKLNDKWLELLFLQGNLLKLFDNVYFGNKEKILLIKIKKY